MSQLNDLVNILLPPANPVCGGDVNWSAVEAKYKISIPDDFRELISLYGAGSIDGFVWLLSPFCENENVSFEKSFYFIEAYSVMRADFPGDYPRPDFPDESAFFPWAVTDNGETFSWVVNGPPNEWAVVVHSVDQGEEEVYRFGAVEFLNRLLRKEIRSRILPSHFPSDAASFLTVSRPPSGDNPGDE